MEREIYQSVVSSTAAESVPGLSSPQQTTTEQLPGPGQQRPTLPSHGPRHQGHHARRGDLQTCPSPSQTSGGSHQGRQDLGLHSVSSEYFPGADFQQNPER